MIERSFRSAAVVLLGLVSVILLFSPTATSQCGGCIRILTCDYGYSFNYSTCDCEPDSPIIIDVGGNGFSLTDAAHGVLFDFSGTGKMIQTAWTAPGAQNAFLVLDRNDDGIINNGSELFGNFTPQPQSPHLNGFAALAVYDLPENGGNGDGIIDALDRIFPSLRLWIDTNHDGVSQPEELYTLPSLGVNSISLNYHLSMRRDQFGNLFRYRAKVNPTGPDDDSEVGRAAYDVFFTTTTTP
jgi:hypothetical protein